MIRTAAISILLLGGCKRPTAEVTANGPAPSVMVVDAAADSAVSTAVTVDAAKAVAEVVAPSAGCDPHPELRWDPLAIHPLVADMQTTAAVRTFAVAPGTKLVVAHALEPKGEVAPAVAYKVLGAPKSASFADATLTWRVDAAIGTKTAMTVVAIANDDPKKRCASIPLVVEVVDDDARRLQQAKWIARETWEERANLAANKASKEKDEADGSDDQVEKARREAFRGARFSGSLVDLDGDGEKDALLDFPIAYDNDEGVTLVLTRRKDTFFPLGRIRLSRLDHAFDGTPLLIAEGGCCCHSELSIARIFPNRVQSLVKEDLAGDCDTLKVGFDLQRTAAGLTGYESWEERSSVRKAVHWKWNGKGFVIGS